MKAIQNDYRPSETVQKSYCVSIPLTDNNITQTVEQLDRAKIEEFLSTLKPKILEEYKTNFMLYLNDNPLFKRILESKGYDSDIIQYQWNRFVNDLMKLC